MPHLVASDFGFFGFFVVAQSGEKSALQWEERTRGTTSSTAATLKEKAKNNFMINAWPVVLIATKQASSGPHDVTAEWFYYQPHCD